MQSVISAINEKMYDVKSDLVGEKEIKTVVSIYREIEAELEFRAIRAIREYNKVIPEMLESLTDRYNKVKTHIRQYPDVDNIDLDIHLVETNYVSVEFHHDGSVYDLPIAWLADDTWEEAVEKTAKTRIEKEIGRINRMEEANREKLEERKAKLLKELEEVDKSLGAL